MFRVLGIFLVVVGLGAAVFYLFGSNSNNTDHSESRTLSVGYQESPAMALIMVANSKGFFSKNGLSVDLKGFNAGKFALQAFLGGSVDVAVAGDVPIGLAALQKQDLQAFVEVLANSKNEVRVVSRKDGGCQGVTATEYFTPLPGQQRKKVGTSFGGGPHYFTYKFMEANNIPISSLELLAQNPQDMPNAIASGGVDALVIFDPAAARAERLLGAMACTFPDPGVYRQHYIAVARPDAVKRDTKKYVAFVNALRAAEEFVKNNRAESIDIVARVTKLSHSDIESFWTNYEFGVALDNGLVQLWAEQANWHRQLQGDKAYPEIVDFNQYINRAIIDQ
jgi:ABC-type nitrate/sulfonate/bicarbonate transport system substrate-binding protein